MVNSIAADWRTLVDGGDQDDLCSEHDIFMIRHRSMYLACALQKFVDQDIEVDMAAMYSALDWLDE